MRRAATVCSLAARVPHVAVALAGLFVAVAIILGAGRPSDRGASPEDDSADDGRMKRPELPAINGLAARWRINASPSCRVPPYGSARHATMLVSSEYGSDNATVMISSMTAS